MSGQVLNMPLRCACLAYFFKKQIGEISSNVQQYTALYVVQDLSINQTFLNSIFPIIVPAGKYTLKLINSCIKIWFQTFPQITKKGKKMALFLSIQDFIVIFEHASQLAIVPFSLVQNICLSAGVATRRATKINMNMYL